MPSGYCERGLRPKSRSKGLTKTVPPSGVNLSKFSDATWSTQVKTAKQNDQTLPVPHTLVTQYRYNSLNQVVEQISPDGGLSKFWYDRLGRLVFSQNAKQVLLNQYSYTKYDKLGRIEEVGQLTSSAAMTQATAQSESATITWWNTQVNNSREQITRTKYDEAQTTLCSPAPSVLCQKNLRNRVSYTYVQNSASSDNTNPPYVTATYYSYDIHGNVDVLLQHYSSGIMQSSGSNAFKRIEYKYDLISGKVNEVAYQPGYSDQFYHRYSYDAENKLTKVFTSPDRVVWEQEADYRYYRHGPLARVELGQVGVQGVDYAYTLQGWLKTVNSTAVTAAADMGGDGTLTGRKIAADVYGFALHYNSTDYKAINLSKTVIAPVTSTGLPAFKDLYNGNIAAMAVTFKHTSFGANNTSGLNQPLLYKYRYDQLNRIKEMDAYSGLNQATNAWTFGSPLTAYQERVSYDGNGNILTYTRNGDAARTAMDNMTYSYVSGTNRLDKVVDVAPDATSNYSDYNDLRTGQLPGNYSYDAIGNLIVEKEKIGTNTVTTNITWNVYGKIASVTKGGVTTSYTYDASGNRISKTTGSKTTWYVRDASGNVMAVYESGNASVNGGNLSQIEVHLYGSSRLGMWTPNRNVQVIPSAQNTTMIGVTNGVGVTRTYKRGQKFFELSNHLGNVLVTVTDRKVAIQNGTTGTILNYVADVVSGGDYYPFGMQMPSRKYQSVTLSSAEGYRYGFNGKEKDKDLNSLTAYDYGFRIYNPAIGKFLSVDPLAVDYPWNSTYAYAENDVIRCIDLEGGEKLDRVQTIEYKGDAIDILRGPENGLRKTFNSLIVDTWNSGVDFFTSLGRGTLVRDVKTDVVQGATTIRNNFVSAYNYHTKTPIGQQAKAFLEYATQPERLEDITQYWLFSRAASGGNSGQTLLRNPTVETPKKISNKPAVEVNAKNTNAANSNTALQKPSNVQTPRPTPAQSEAALTPKGPNELNQPIFKNGNLQTKKIKSSVIPESYNFFTSVATEVKNFTFKPTGASPSSINTLVTQILQRQSNLPKGTIQNIIVDIRGQNVGLFLQWEFRKAVLERVRTPNVNITFQTQ